MKLRNVVWDRVIVEEVTEEQHEAAVEHSAEALGGGAVPAVDPGCYVHVTRESNVHIVWVWNGTETPRVVDVYQTSSEAVASALETAEILAGDARKKGRLVVDEAEPESLLQ